LKLVKKRVPEEIPILGFNATAYEPQNSHLVEICENNNIVFSHNLRKGLDSSGNHSKLLTEDKTHWSEWGHEVAAKIFFITTKNKLLFLTTEQLPF
jgi:hypothetical protein